MTRMKSKTSCCAGSRRRSPPGSRPMSGRSTACSRPKQIMLWVTLATIAGTIWLYIIVPKGFFPTEDTGYVIGITEAQYRHRISGDGGAPAQDCRARARRQGVAYVNSTVGTGGPNHGRQQRPHAGRAQAAQRTRQHAADHRTAAPERERRSRHSDFLPADPEHQSRRPAEQEPVSVHAAVQRHRRSLSYHAGIARQDRANSRAARRYDRPLREEPASDGRSRS